MPPLPDKAEQQTAGPMSYIPFPDISPEIFAIDLGPVTFALRWYALAYIIGLIAGWKLIVRMVTTQNLWPAVAPAKPEQIERLLTWVIMGVILGGRMGYVLFYDLPSFAADPLSIVRVWEGGMSFHGGFLGVVVAGILFCRREKIPMLPMADLMAAVVPIGLFLGRIANFINAELWGRPTTMPWGVAFPGDAAQTCATAALPCIRHPSQLYEAGLEGLLLMVVFTYLIWRRGWFRWPGAIAGLFFAGYGAARFVVEFFRQPDAQFVSMDNPLGLYVQFGGWGLTAGQLLSLPMIIVGLWFLVRAKDTQAKSA